jgi:hypothetical protein
VWFGAGAAPSGRVTWTCALRPHESLLETVNNTRYKLLKFIKNQAF